MNVTSGIIPVQYLNAIIHQHVTEHFVRLHVHMHLKGECKYAT